VIRRVLWVGIPLLTALHAVSAGHGTSCSGGLVAQVILLGTASGPTINRSLASARWSWPDPRLLADAVQFADALALRTSVWASRKCS
jgi:hypothetical protein